MINILLHSSNLSYHWYQTIKKVLALRFYYLKPTFAKFQNEKMAILYGYFLFCSCNRVLHSTLHSIYLFSLFATTCIWSIILIYVWSEGFCLHLKKVCFKTFLFTDFRTKTMFKDKIHYYYLLTFKFCMIMW